MGKRGPAPTPTNILNARGSWRGAKRAKEPVRVRGKTKPPTWLCREARAVFRAVCDDLDALGVLSTTDVRAIARYADGIIRYSAAVKDLHENGSTYEGRSGERLRPVMRVAESLAALLGRLEGQFGLTPAARAGLAVDLKSGDADGVSKFLKAGGAP